MLSNDSVKPVIRENQIRIAICFFFIFYRVGFTEWPSYNAGKNCIFRKLPHFMGYHHTKKIYFSQDGTVKS